MLRTKHFENLVNEAVNEGFDQGVKFFMESLENHLEQNEIMENAGGEENFFHNVLKSGITNTAMDLNEGVEDISEEHIDELVKKYGFHE